MCLFNWPQTQLANISKTINPQFCLQDEHWWMMTVRAGRKPTCIQKTWFNIVIFNLNAILFFHFSFAVKSKTVPNVNWDGQKHFMHYQNGRNFTPESHSTTSRPVSVSVVITYLLWLQEMHPQRPYHLVAAGRHRLLVSHEWAPDRFFIFTTVVWLFLLGVLGPEQRDWICVLERVRVSHS